MYYNVIFISYLPLSKEFEVPESVRDVAMIILPTVHLFLPVLLARKSWKTAISD